VTDAAATALSRPPSLRGRRLGVDAARGIALLAIMAVHALPATDAAGHTTFWHHVTNGRSAAAFVLLAGVGLALMTGGPRPASGIRLASARRVTAVRAGAIGLIGLALGSAPSGAAVILAYFTVLFLLALPLLGLGARAAAVAAGLRAAGMPLVSAAVRDWLPVKDLTNPTLGDLVQRPLELLSQLTWTGYYPALPWLAYVAAGIAIGRLPLHSPRVAAALLAGGGGLAAVSAVVSQWLLGPGGGLDVLAASASRPAPQVKELLERSMFGTVPTDTWWWQAVDAPYSSTGLEIAQGIGTTAALLGACLLLERVARRALVPLAAAGSMTLTAYAVHLLVQASDLLAGRAALSWTLQAVGALVLGTLWRLRVGRGPLEALVARLSDRARPPGREVPAAEPVRSLTP
jgi:uncharacterized membrane protein